MGPTPEPLPNGGLSDEEMPQQPPIFLSSSDDEDDTEEPINPDYPAGYLPIAHHIQILWDSDDSDVEAEQSSPPSPPVPALLNAEVRDVQTVQETRREEASAEEAIDYNSLAGLMTALAANGPNQVVDQCGLQSAYLDDSEPEDSATGPSRPSRRLVSRRARTNETTASNTTAPTDPTLQPPEEDRLPLAPDQEAAVLRAMQGFTLPASAIPPWASDLPDTALTTLLRDKLQRPSAN